MIRYLLAAALAAFAAPAFAQNQSGPFFTNGPVGQSPGGIQAGAFSANSPNVGFQDNTIATGVVAAGTTQGTATLLGARNNVIATCTSGAGVELPSVERYTPVTIMNRSGAACLVYPSPGASAESAPGTAGSVNAGVSQANNTTVTYKPVDPTHWLQ